ncbi:MAG: enoyl-CoA hydratase/isomerase family protein [Burkholderiaceae bacterium]|jgi:enoyl-CoA hydratase/carnithine racemase|nr:enoyl-CoA hydratase/isomerase family protein [Burkholderiaceae bacterium]
MIEKTVTPATGVSPATEEPQPRPEPLYVEREDAVATIVINQPEKQNVITLAMWQELPGIVDALSGDDSLRCVVLRGTGEEAFSAGCDISEFANVRANRKQSIVYGHAMQKALAAFERCRHPLVAVSRGICLGAGVELLSLCDIRICCESATFGLTAKTLGMALSYAELEPLLRLLGPDTLLELLLEGRVFPAAEAKEKKLVTRVVPDDMLAEETALTIQRIIKGAPLVARWHKQFVRRLSVHPHPVTAKENLESFDSFDTEDYRSGCAAFLLRDHPVFKGK